MLGKFRNTNRKQLVYAKAYAMATGHTDTNNLNSLVDKANGVYQVRVFFPRCSFVKIMDISILHLYILVYPTAYCVRQHWQNL